jgi:hypothetical protein
MQGVGTTPPAVLFQLNPARVVLFVLGGGVVPPLTLCTGKRDDYPHCQHLPCQKVKKNMPSVTKYALSNLAQPYYRCQLFLSLFLSTM